MSDRVSTPLDRERPLWEVYFIDDYGDGAAMLVRIHHCVADGIALARVMLLLTDGGAAASTPGIDALPAVDGSRLGLVSPLVRAAEGAAHEGLRTLLHPRHAGELAGAALADGETLAKLLLPWSDPRSPIKGRLQRAHRVAWSAPVELWRVKRAGHALGATVNDVLVAAVAGAIGRHLRERGEELDEVHALVPFNLRPLDRPLPPELGNRFGLVLLGLPVGIADPIARLAEVKHAMDAIKNGHEGPLTYGILGLMGRTPPVVEQRLIDYFSAKGSMVLTNVPGPRASAVAGRRAVGRRARVGAVLGERRHERQRVQLRPQGDGRLPRRRRSGAGPPDARRRLPRRGPRARPRGSRRAGVSAASARPRPARRRSARASRTGRPRACAAASAAPAATAATSTSARAARRRRAAGPAARPARR